MKFCTNKNCLVTIPNILSISRIIATPTIFFLREYKFILLLVLILIGITDVLDGYIARKNKKETIIGSMLDSLSDFVFFLSLIVYAILFEIDIIMSFKYYVIAILGLKLLTVTTGIVKYKKLCFLHTYGNKLTGIVIFVGFCYFIFFGNTMLIKIAIFISLISSLEELIIILLGNKYLQNTRGIWEIKK